jgi:hypothetical protein
MRALTGNDLPHELNIGLSHYFSEDKMSVCLSAVHSKNRRQACLSTVLGVAQEAGTSHNDFEINFLQNFEKYLLHRSFVYFIKL